MKSKENSRLHNYQDANWYKKLIVGIEKVKTTIDYKSYNIKTKINFAIFQSLLYTIESDLGTP